MDDKLGGKWQGRAPGRKSSKCKHKTLSDLTHSERMRLQPALTRETTVDDLLSGGDFHVDKHVDLGGEIERRKEEMQEAKSDWVRKLKDLGREDKMADFKKRLNKLASDIYITKISAEESDPTKLEIAKAADHLMDSIEFFRPAMAEMRKMKEPEDRREYFSDFFGKPEIRFFAEEMVEILKPVITKKMYSYISSIPGLAGRNIDVNELYAHYYQAIQRMIRSLVTSLSDKNVDDLKHSDFAAFLNKTLGIVIQDIGEKLFKEETGVTKAHRGGKEKGVVEDIVNPKFHDMVVEKLNVIKQQNPEQYERLYNEYLAVKNGIQFGAVENISDDFKKFLVNTVNEYREAYKYPAPLGKINAELKKRGEQPITLKDLKQGWSGKRTDFYDNAHDRLKEELAKRNAPELYRELFTDNRLNFRVFNVKYLDVPESSLDFVVEKSTQRRKNVYKQDLIRQQQDGDDSREEAFSDESTVEKKIGVMTSLLSNKMKETYDKAGQDIISEAKELQGLVNSYIELYKGFSQQTGGVVTEGSIIERPGLRQIAEQMQLCIERIINQKVIASLAEDALTYLINWGSGKDEEYIKVDLQKLPGKLLDSVSTGQKQADNIFPLRSDVINGLFFAIVKRFFQPVQDIVPPAQYPGFLDQVKPDITAVISDAKSSASYFGKIINDAVELSEIRYAVAGGMKKYASTEKLWHDVLDAVVKQSAKNGEGVIDKFAKALRFISIFGIKK